MLFLVSDFTFYTLYGIFMGMWQIEMEPIKDWLDGLDKQTAYQVYAALDLLRERGPNLKRPLVGENRGLHHRLHEGTETRFDRSKRSPNPVRLRPGTQSGPIGRRRQTEQMEQMV